MLISNDLCMILLFSLYLRCNSIYILTFLQILWKVDFQDEKFGITKFSEFHLPKCKPHWWSTCALYIKSSSSLIVGDKGGTINFYLSESANNKIVSTIFIQLFKISFQCLILIIVKMFLFFRLFMLLQRFLLFDIWMYHC